jgi:UDP-N-acetylglucosamine:LPS N-acetylglucosamine transferase
VNGQLRTDRTAYDGKGGKMQFEGRRVLAISSSGGHWIQLRAITANIDGAVVYVTTQAPAESVSAPIYYVPDANKGSPLRLLGSALRVLYLVIRLRPDAIVTTGAAPGCLAVLLGRLMGKPVVFIDSIANAEAISLSGRIAARLGVATLTQWPHLAGVRGVQYAGHVFGELE